MKRDRPLILAVDDEPANLTKVMPVSLPLSWVNALGTR